MERKFHDAVGSLRLVDDAEERWGVSLGGWKGIDAGDPPAIFVKAIAAAHPMPTTFQEVVDEYRYWAWRTYMAAMSIACDGETPTEVLREPFEADLCLDLTVVIRIQLLTPLLLEALQARSIEEIETRLAIHAAMDGRSPLLAAVRRDLAALRQARPKPRTKRRSPRDRAAPKGSTLVGVQDERITAQLLRDPTQSDRAIARELRVSQSTVGKERGILGLKNVKRTVQRGDRQYVYAATSPVEGEQGQGIASLESTAPAPTPPEEVETFRDPKPNNERAPRGRLTKTDSVGDQLDWVTVVTGDARCRPGEDLSATRTRRTPERCAGSSGSPRSRHPGLHRSVAE